MIAVLGDLETVMGFRMAGIKDCLETNEGNLEGNLEKTKDKEIIILNEKLYKLIGGEERKNIFIPIPDKYGSTGIDTVKDLIKGIIGKELGE
jgi:vacuolar-type H+-ATPase subunit F/Vma7